MRLSSLKAAQNNQLAVKASDEGEGAKSSRLGVERKRMSSSSSQKEIQTGGFFLTSLNKQHMGSTSSNQHSPFQSMVNEVNKRAMLQSSQGLSPAKQLQGRGTSSASGFRPQSEGKRFLCHRKEELKDKKDKLENMFKSQREKAQEEYSKAFQKGEKKVDLFIAKFKSSKLGNLTKESTTQLQQKVLAQKNLLSKISFEQKVKNDKINEIKEQLRSQQLLTDSTSYQEQFDILQKEADEIDRKLSQQVMKNRIYNHIVSDIKETIQSWKEPYNRMKIEANKLKTNNHMFEAMQNTDIHKVKIVEGNFEKLLINFEKLMNDEENYKGKEKETIKNRVLMGELLDYEKTRAQNEENEKHEKKREEHERKYKEMIQSQKVTSAKLVRLESELSKQSKEEEEIRKATDGVTLYELLERLRNVEHSKLGLEDVQKVLTENKKEEQMLYDECREEILKFMVEGKAQVEDTNVQEVENKLHRQLQEQIQFEEKSQKMEEILSEIVSVVTRIYEQVEPTDKQTRNIISMKNVDEYLIMAGLRLERKMAIISQKTQIFPVESINSDLTISKIPKYLNIDDRPRNKDPTQRPKEEEEEANDASVMAEMAEISKVLKGSSTTADDKQVAVSNMFLESERKDEDKNIAAKKQKLTKKTDQTMLDANKRIANVIIENVKRRNHLVLPPIDTHQGYGPKYMTSDGSIPKKKRKKVGSPSNKKTPQSSQQRLKKTKQIYQS